MSGSDNLSSSKKALVIRYGAIGDAIVVTPLLKKLKEDGYHVTLNGSEYSRDVYKNNPNVDTFIEHITGSVPSDHRLELHWKKMSEGYDRVINLSESLEKALLLVDWQPEYKWSKEQRHEKCNKNYYDWTMALSGYKDATGLNGDLYFSKNEEAWASDVRAQYKKRFLVLYSLSGSSYHKVYPYADAIITRFLNAHSDAVTFTIGSQVDRLLEWDHPQARKRCGVWDVRKSLIMTKYVNLFVGSETGMSYAAGCFDTPKIIMLSHSSEENMTKYWANTTVLKADSPCQPCHQLHYKRESCPLKSISPEVPDVEMPVCMVDLPPERLYNALEAAYTAWKGGLTWQLTQPHLTLTS